MQTTTPVSANSTKTSGGGVVFTSSSSSTTGRTIKNSLSTSTLMTTTTTTNNRINNIATSSSNAEIEEISKKISEHADAIYRTWKSHGLAPTELLEFYNNNNNNKKNNSNNNNNINKNNNNSNNNSKTVESNSSAAADFFASKVMGVGVGGSVGVGAGSGASSGSGSGSSSNEDAASLHSLVASFVSKDKEQQRKGGGAAGTSASTVKTAKIANSMAKITTKTPTVPPDTTMAEAHHHHHRANAEITATTKKTPSSNNNNNKVASKSAQITSTALTSPAKTTATTTAITPKKSVKTSKDISCDNLLSTSSASISNVKERKTLSSQRNAQSSPSPPTTLPVNKENSNANDDVDNEHSKLSKLLFQEHEKASSSSGGGGEEEKHRMTAAPTNIILPQHSLMNGKLSSAEPLNFNLDLDLNLGLGLTTSVVTAGGNNNDFDMQKLDLNNLTQLQTENLKLIKELLEDNSNKAKSRRSADTQQATTKKSIVSPSVKTSSSSSGIAKGITNKNTISTGKVKNGDNPNRRSISPLSDAQTIILTGIDVVPDSVIKPKNSTLSTKQIIGSTTATPKITATKSGGGGTTKSVKTIAKERISVANDRDRKNAVSIKQTAIMTETATEAEAEAEAAAAALVHALSDSHDGGSNSKPTNEPVAAAAAAVAVANIVPRTTPSNAIRSKSVGAGAAAAATASSVATATTAPNGSGNGTDVLVMEVARSGMPAPTKSTAASATKMGRSAAAANAAGGALSNGQQEKYLARPILTRGSVAERVLMFEKCPDARLSFLNIKRPDPAEAPPKSLVKVKLHATPPAPPEQNSLQKEIRSTKSVYIPRFYFPHGKPQPQIAQERTLRGILSAFDSFPNNQVTKDELPRILQLCGLPFYWRMPVMVFCQQANSGLVERQRFVEFWKQMNVYCHDSASRFVYILSRGQRFRSYILPEDLAPMVQDVVDTHPGLAFLKEATEFHSRYVHTVIARIFYAVNRSWSGRISIAELKKSDLLEIISMLEEEDDINQIMAFFSYEHFYVIYCKFWELDKDHDLLINQDDLARHSDHALSTRIVERIFSGCVTRNDNKKSPDDEPKMSYTDFVWFLLSEEDKRSPTAIEYWFRCMDIDGDGVISMYELEYFYEEQQQRMESIGIETLPFEDCLCQMLDMIKPQQNDCISLGDLKRCRMTHVFFDTFFNLEKYLDHEQRDPFASQRDEYASDWDRFAAQEYELLITEEND